MVKPKKHLGQHFLTDKNIAEKIVNTISGHKEYQSLVEIGAGTGVLTEFLVDSEEDFDFHIIEIDSESIIFLKETYPQIVENLHEADFLKYNLNELFTEPFGIIGNFPYNISSQIFFKVLDYRHQVMEVVGMIQKEVAQRITSPPGNKTYGILSVLLQAFYDLKYEFTVPPNVFNPPPKVDSAVVSLKRNDVEKLDCDEKFFFRVVKQGFNNRRKTLRNALKPLVAVPVAIIEQPLLNQRAEQLSVEDFVLLTNWLQDFQKSQSSISSS